MNTELNVEAIQDKSLSRDKVVEGAIPKVDFIYDETQSFGYDTDTFYMIGEKNYV